MMPLESQVVSLDLAKRMKELGFPQDGLFYWHEFADSSVAILSENQWPRHLHFIGHKCWAAPTVAELGELLKSYGSFIQWDNDLALWRVQFNAFDRTFKTEAEARAKAWIYLRENKLIEGK